MQKIETERKYLIRYPDIGALLLFKDCKVKKIVQTYLIAPKGQTKRVRRCEEDGIVSYIFNHKTRISELSSTEEEYEVDKTEYETLISENRMPGYADIEKTRYYFPYRDHIIEIDVYGFWNDRAILETELSSEDETAEIPDIIKIIKEVTADKRYKNVSLAKEVITEEI